MKRYSRLTKDQPEAPIQRFLWWTEYVLRHNGAPHLKSPSIDMPWYQYLLLDIITVHLIVIFLACLLIRGMLRMVKSKEKNE